jgi:hypothetical protein
MKPILNAFRLLIVLVVLASLTRDDIRALAELLRAVANLIAR